MVGLSAEPSAVQSVLVIPGATSTAEVMPFWRAALGYEPRRDSPAQDLVDPHGRGLGFWFERMNEPRADGGGAIHVVVWVPHEHAEARIAAALAAGGRMVRDEFARSWWTWLTQPETRSTSPPRRGVTDPTVRTRRSLATLAAVLLILVVGIALLFCESGEGLAREAMLVLQIAARDFLAFRVHREPALTASQKFFHFVLADPIVLFIVEDRQ